MTNISNLSNIEKYTTRQTTHTYTPKENQRNDNMRQPSRNSYRSYDPCRAPASLRSCCSTSNSSWPWHGTANSFIATIATIATIAAIAAIAAIAGALASFQLLLRLGSGSHREKKCVGGAGYGYHHWTTVTHMVQSPQILNIMKPPRCSKEKASKFLFLFSFCAFGLCCAFPLCSFKRGQEGKTEILTHWKNIEIYCWIQYEIDKNTMENLKTSKSKVTQSIAKSPN